MKSIHRVIGIVNADTVEVDIRGKTRTVREALAKNCALVNWKSIRIERDVADLVIAATLKATVPHPPK